MDDLVKQRFKAIDKALKLQAKEYGRRLSELNHAHQQSREKERDFISTEVYSRDIRELTGKINALERAESNRLGQFAAAGLGLTLLVIAIQVLLHFIK